MVIPIADRTSNYQLTPRQLPFIVDLVRAYLSLFVKSNFGITPILSGIFIDKIGYLSLFPYAAICAACAFITFSQVKHGDIILNNEVK